MMTEQERWKTHGFEAIKRIIDQDFVWNQFVEAIITITTTNIGTKNISSSLPTFLVLNPYHIIYKLEVLRGVIDINAMSVAILTESWLTENTPNSAVALNNFATYRLDRRSPGGGVLVYVNHKVRTKLLPEY